MHSSKEAKQTNSRGEQRHGNDDDDGATSQLVDEKGKPLLVSSRKSPTANVTTDTGTY